MILFNTGRRVIKYGKEKTALFRPGTSIDFPDAVAKYLLRLYKGEIKKPEQFAADYVSSDAAPKADKKAGRPKKK